MHWFEIAHNYSDAKPYVVAESSSIVDASGAQRLSGSPQSDIGTSLFTEEMIALHPDLRDALEAWRAEDSRMQAHSIASATVNEMQSIVSDIAGQLGDFWSGHDLIREYADEDPVCAQVIAIREHVLAVQKLLPKERLNLRQGMPPNYEEHPVLKDLIAEARALYPDQDRAEESKSEESEPAA
jgi:hypothetical protein